jgi:exonuclease III
MFRKNQTKIVSWNVNSIRAIYEKISLIGLKMKMPILFAYKKQKLIKHNSAKV